VTQRAGMPKLLIVVSGNVFVIEGRRQSYDERSMCSPRK